MPTGYRIALTDEQVAEIRSLASTVTQAEIARRYGLTRLRVRKVLVSGGIETPRELGPKSHVWNGGMKRKGRYMMIRRPEHPRATGSGYVMRYRWVMEQKIGRLLVPGEHVHHINRDTLDDSPGNLQLLTAGEHMRLHADERRGHRWHDKPLYRKVTPHMAVGIAAAIIAGETNCTAIGRRFNVSGTVVRQIRDGKHWTCREAS